MRKSIVQWLGIVGLVGMAVLYCGNSDIEGKAAIKRDFKTLKLANGLHKYGKDNHFQFPYTAVAKIVKASMEFEASHPQKPYKALDLIALAWVESEFNPAAVGKAGERGAWQVLDWKEYMKEVGGKNPFDVRTNLAMAACELDRKLAQYSDFKTSLVAYNGMYYREDGSLDDWYFWEFNSKRRILQALLEGRPVGVGQYDALAKLDSPGFEAIKDWMAQ